MKPRPSSLRRVARLGAISACLILAVMLQPSEASMVLAWDPSPEPAVIGYRVYVGTERGVYSETYDVPSHETWFVYTNSTGGVRYYFAVAARAEGNALSALSEEVTGVARFIRSSPGDAALASAAPPADSLCIDAAAPPCHSATVIATDLGIVSSLAATGDGRVLFVEDHRRVRVLTAATRSIQTALDVGSSGMQLTDITVDPSFGQSRLVFVGESRLRTDGSADLHIIRYRELGGRLGEGASVVGVLPLPPAGRAPFAVDAARNVFVAMPAGAEGNRRAAFGEQILAFTAEGRTLALDGGASPIIAGGGSRPSALTWDRQGQRLWISQGAGTGPTLARVELAGSREPWARAGQPLTVHGRVTAFVL